MSWMMQSPSKLNPAETPVFLDTSVLINLLAADCAEEIATALGRDLLVNGYVVKELIRDPRDNSDGLVTMRGLFDKGVVKLVEPTPGQSEEFVRLVGAIPPDDLGDGEAATLACARGGFAAIDERKARRIGVRDFPDTTLYTTLDLLAAPAAFRHFGEARVREMIRRARSIGRMRVPHEWREWVAALGDAETDAVRSGFGKI
jgi:hypothetical protein